MTSPAKFNVTPTEIDGLLIIEPKVLGDESSWFMESFNARDLSAAIGSEIKFVQDNQSFSKQWTLRGIHFQTDHPQGKLVRAIQGCIFDVVVDVRKNSATYGQYVGAELSAENHKQLWVSPGLAHGFLVLSPTAEILYKTTDYYHPQNEVCLAWNDLDVGISWPLPEGVAPIMSAKDVRGSSLKYLADNLNQ
jgi:dTDP-4-dehydrorhamnose 3,5-epimerase